VRIGETREKGEILANGGRAMSGAGAGEGTAGPWTTALLPVLACRRPGRVIEKALLQTPRSAVTEPPPPAGPPEPGPPASPWNPGPQPAAPAPSPWNPAPARSGPGCSKPVLIGCGGLLVILGIGAILFILKAQSLVQWYFEKLEDSMASRLPDDATPAERQRLHAAFAGARAAFANGTADPTRMQLFQRKLLEAAGPDKKMTRQQLRDLAAALEDIARRPAPAAPPRAPAAPGSPRAPAG
jgi:hypothetical protein